MRMPNKLVKIGLMKRADKNIEWSESESKTTFISLKVERGFGEGIYMQIA